MALANVLQPLNDVEEWVLESLHAAGLSWGLAIVALTLLTRFLMLPLIVKQFRSGREMKRHMPELRRIQQRHRGDRERVQRETAAYYREHGINPLASLAPLLIQIPVFISLYTLLRHDAATGLFGDGGFLLIGDLTAQAHGAALAAILLVYLASQVGSSAIATRAMSGNHRKLALAAPVLFAGFIARFPAGLAIYSVTTSLWSLGQQLAFWRLGAGAPAGAAALASEVEDVVEAK